MSQQLSFVRTDIRYLLNDTDPSDYAVGSLVIDRILVGKAHELAAEIGLAYSWQTAAVTLTADDMSDLTLTSTLEYWQVHEARDTTNGYRLTKVSLPEVNRMREGVISTALAAGDPRYFAVWEEASTNANDQTHKCYMRLDCVPRVSTTLDLLVQTIPNLDSYSDTTMLPFPDSMGPTLVKAVAVQLLARMTDDQREGLKIGASVMDQWAQDVAVGVANEKRRQRNLKRGPYGKGAVGSWL